MVRRKMSEENRIEMSQTSVDELAPRVNTFEGRPYVAWSLDFDEGDETGECFELRWEDVEEGRCEYVHALDVGCRDRFRRGKFRRCAMKKRFQQRLRIDETRLLTRPMDERLQDPDQLLFSHFVEESLIRSERTESVVGDFSVERRTFSRRQIVVFFGCNLRRSI